MKLQRVVTNTLLLVLLTLPAAASVVVRVELEPGVTAANRGGRQLFLECSPPRGDAGQAFLRKYLANPADWKMYKDRMAVAIPYAKLNQDAKRRVLEAIFPDDYVDEQGWWHTVALEGEEGQETWWALAEWLTGMGTNYKAIQGNAANRGVSSNLSRGARILVPMKLLLPSMKRLSPADKRPAAAPTPAKPAQTPPPPQSDFTTLYPNGHDLEYGKDSQGAYAAYRLKKGEAIFSSVVVRFTDYRETREILEAVDIVLDRSRIHDPRKLKAGHRILIPMDMLSDRYKPEGSEQRQAYEAVRREAARLRAERVTAKDLDGVVIILDPGHGGRDHGAAQESAGLYEDELNYDITIRIKALLETQTRARVYITQKDLSQGFTPSSARTFSHDTDEILLTTPPYDNLGDARVSANLRWYLANQYYRDELARGVNEMKVLFASIHCDALFNESMRGAMVYIPGAQYRQDRETPPAGAFYSQFQEVRNHRLVTTTLAQRTREEALSRDFAATLLRTLDEHNPPLVVHKDSDPIRNVIRRTRTQVWVPAILRNAMIPTKVLVEAANLTNPEDRRNLADPQWRQAFAEAFVEAVRRHFESS